MSENIGRLGDAELEIMLVVWHSEQPVTSNYILDKLQGKRKWALSTLMTSLTRLEKKQFISCDRSTGTNLYSTLIEETAYKQKESSTFLERLYDNSFKGLVSSLYSSKAIGKRDLAELRKFLDQMDKEV